MTIKFYRKCSLLSILLCLFLSIHTWPHGKHRPSQICRLATDERLRDKCQATGFNSWFAFNLSGYNENISNVADMASLVKIEICRPSIKRCSWIVFPSKLEQVRTIRAITKTFVKWPAVEIMGGGGGLQFHDNKLLLLNTYYTKLYLNEIFLSPIAYSPVKSFCLLNTPANMYERVRFPRLCCSPSILNIQEEKAKKLKWAITSIKSANKDGLTWTVTCMYSCMYS